jgi:hypothetical protein
VVQIMSMKILIQDQVLPGKTYLKSCRSFVKERVGYGF